MATDITGCPRLSGTCLDEKGEGLQEEHSSRPSPDPLGVLPLHGPTARDEPWVPAAPWVGGLEDDTKGRAEGTWIAGRCSPCRHPTKNSPVSW